MWGSFIWRWCKCYKLHKLKMRAPASADVSFNQEFHMALIQVAVCTPGRMIDLIKMKACTCKRVTYLVFDEADRMFDMGFEPQVTLLAQTS